MASKSKRARRVKRAAAPSNDNAPIGAANENTWPEASEPHVYVGTKKHGFVVSTNLPERISLLDSELVLVQKYMGTFVNSILANDNETK